MSQSMREKIARTIAEHTAAGEMEALLAARAALGLLEKPTLFMQNEGWRQLGEQGIDPTDIDIAPIFHAMIRAAKEGK